MKNVASKLFTSRKRGALVFIVIFAILGVALLLSGHAAVVNNGSGPYTIIVNNQRPDMEDSYQNLVNSQTNLAMRSTNPDPTTPETNNWEAEGRNYFFTTASSDFPVNKSFNHPSIYTTLSQAQAVLARPHSRGLYMHEVVSSLASKNNFNWSKAVTQINWTLLDQQVMAAKAVGKKVVWSEPSYGWQYLNQNLGAGYYFNRWGNTLVPMFATNFPSQVDAALAAAKGVATNVVHSDLGESVQSWYFRDQNQVPTEANTLALINKGLSNGAKYYQIEGEENIDKYTNQPVHDMVWGTPYLNGIYDFTNQLQAAAVAAARSVTPTPPPTTPLYSYYSANNIDHFYTITRNDATLAYYGYAYEGCEGLVYPTNPTGTVPLYRYYNSAKTDHFYTVDRNDAGYANYGYTFENIEGYVYSYNNPVAGNVPLYRYFNSNIIGHYYTTTRNDAGLAYYGYSLERIEAYVQPPPAGNCK